MILTDRFVFMHVPKTGGTFVTRVLRELLTPNLWDWRIHAVGRRYGVYFPGYPYKYREIRQHAMRKHIPARFSELPIASCVRNPYDIYVSGYTFNWWRENPERWFVDPNAVVSEFGPLENFDFPAYVRATIKHSHWSNTCRKNYPNLPPMSYCSTEFLHYHVIRPKEVVADATRVEDFVPRAQESMQGVNFLLTHRLNQDLHAFLEHQGFPTEKIDPILTKGKIHPGKPRRKEDDHWSNHYDEELRALLRESEPLLFAFFPEFDEIPTPTPVGETTS
ncbi:MAG: sulfotransferase family 2 domain-containing protein [Planctomycetaceae bacterium]|nr:sulfotransferase family 2 domain-containing protein [Planctomycetaceae bacterium]